MRRGSRPFAEDAGIMAKSFEGDKYLFGSFRMVMMRAATGPAGRGGQFRPVLDAGENLRQSKRPGARIGYRPLPGDAGSRERAAFRLLRGSRTRRIGWPVGVWKRRYPQGSSKIMGC